MRNDKTPAQTVIDAFGGPKKLADALDCDKSTVCCWVSRGNGLIPAQWQSKILRAARKKEIDIKPGDLVANALA